MNEKTALMKMIKKYDFALYELNLYLDTHPKCMNALACFKKYQDLRGKAVEEYTQKYGPITADQTDTSQGWGWVNEPWPWQRESDV
ncbi:MAG: spore coat protein CotJB [Ruminococcus sp.]|jgi:spore coat protein JB|nr:spore coat protein CotJB [Ruminococcus sp.]